MITRKQILFGLKWTAGARFGSQIITWAITLLIIRLLSPEDYGLMAMATVCVAFMIMVAEAGLKPALIQRQEIDETMLRQAFGIVIVMNLGLMIILNLLAPMIAGFFAEERLIKILHVLSLGFLFIAIATIPGVILERELKFKNLALVELMAGVSTSVLTLILAFAQYGIWALVYGYIFSGLFRALAFNLTAPFYKLPIFSLQGMKSLLFFGGTMSVSRILWFFFSQIDIIIVGRLLGKEALGFYSVAMHLASLPVQKVAAIMNRVSFPVFSRIQHERESIRSYAIKGIRALSFTAFPILWGISSIANEFIMLFLGQKWQNAILPVQLLSLMLPLRMIMIFLATVIDAIGRPDVGVKNVLLASIIMPIAFLIGSQWGIVGVAVAWVTVYPVVLVINIHRMLLVIGLRLNYFFQIIAPALGSTVGMYVAVWGTSWLLGGDIDQIIKLLVMVMIGVLTYVGLSLVINKQGYREILGLFWNK